MPKNRILCDRRGQGAMEYLTNYAWAILIVAVVGMVLYQMGLFNTSTGSTYADFSYLKPMAAAVGYSNNGSFQSAFQNTVGAPIQIISASTYEAVSGTDCAVTQVNGVTMPTEIAIPSGEAFTLTSVCAPRTQGEPYIAAISIQYRAIIRDVVVEHAENGTISGTVE